MGKDALRVEGLRKRYPKVQALDGLSLTVTEGEIFGVLGPNGAGKTTALEIIEGLQTADQGEIEILGMNWRQHAAEIRSRIGVLLQLTTLFPKITPREAIDLFGRYYPKRLGSDHLLRLMNLEDKGDSYQIHLSGGQRQRLATALALVNDPDLVFLDEPTTGLDPQSRHAVWDVIRQFRKQGRTVLLTTHNMEEAEALCDRIAIVDAGRVISQGAPHAIIASHKLPTTIEIHFGTETPDPTGFRLEMVQHIEVVDGTWRIKVEDLPSAMGAIFGEFDRQVVRYQQLRIRTPSIEDVFLLRTGKRLRD